MKAYLRAVLLFKRIEPLQQWLQQQRNAGKSIGFVPTMGALHNGHLSLIDACNKGSDITVCSIFVNPTQFNQQSDLEKYPRPIEHDIELLHDAACEVLFHPEVEEMYPQGTQIKEPIDFGRLGQLLEGAHRPGHFEGMAQVVERLLRIVSPDQLYMGQKDYQQTMIVRKMLEARQLLVDLVICPIIREEDGLAMSSRNVRLNEEERKEALRLSQALQLIEEGLYKDSLEKLKQKALTHLQHPLIKVEYLSIADGHTLEEIEQIDDSEEPVALVAAWVGNTRLIDNVRLLNNA